LVADGGGNAAVGDRRDDDTSLRRGFGLSDQVVKAQVKSAATAG
jgi:hypothetical protein